MIKTRKGILLTLATIVLLVLMLAELITYVYLQINYDTISSFGSLSYSSYQFASSLNDSTSAFLHSSLLQSVNYLISYEGVTVTPRNSIAPINNTAYAIQSLITNGVLYGNNGFVLKGGGTLLNYTNAIELQALSESLNLTISNASLQVYQLNPYTLNATYSALATINSSSGVFTYPILASSGIQVSMLSDLHSVEQGTNYKIRISNSNLSAVAVGNVYASSGSLSPYQFAYGTVIVENSPSSCSIIPAQFRNNNYILAAQSSVNLAGSCGFGGLVTYTPNSIVPNGPYLVYASSSNVFRYINNGTTLLLDGQGLSLLNIYNLQNALYNNSYFSSPFTPSYLDWAQNNVSKKSQNGLYSFDLYSQSVPQFTSSAGNYFIYANSIYTSGSNHVSISLWFNSEALITSSTKETIVGENTTSPSADILELGIKGNSIIFGQAQAGHPAVNSININASVIPNTWHNIVAVYNSTGNSYVYLDGVQVGSSGPFSLGGGSSSSNFLIGSGYDGHFNGTISDVQVYNSALSPSQAATSYYDGISGIPLVPGNLTGWWNLNGNMADYSGKGNAGRASPNSGNNPQFVYLYGYTGNPIYDGSFYSGNITNVVPVLNCENLNQCSNLSQQHLYLNSISLSIANGFTQNEFSSFGLANAVIPNVGIFTVNGYAYAPVNPYYGSSSNPFSLSAWVYLNSNSSGPLINIVGCPSATFSISSCSDVPAISVKKNVIYADLNSQISNTVTNLNSWYHIVLTYSGSNAETLYVNGVSVASSSSGTYSPSSGPYYYWATGCNSGAGSCTNGISSTYHGRIGDVHLFASQLMAANVIQLYLNDNVIGGGGLTDFWPLSNGYTGLENQSINTANALNPALFGYLQSGASSVCTNANMINNLCGAGFIQP